jgi:mono/diheme cytochrome c family protein
MAGFFTALIIGIILIAAFAIASLRSGATAKPTAAETAAVGTAKLWLIPESREAGVPPPKTEQAILDGGEHYNERCAVCHDLSGDADSKFAKSFYPSISDLLSKRVQSYSDGQLKWIIDNGIRYTGMPGWEKTVNDEDQWEIVYYLRVLNSPEQKEHYKQLLQQRGKWKTEVPAGEEEEDQGSGDRTDTEENTRKEKSEKSPSTHDDGAAKEGENHKNE